MKFRTSLRLAFKRPALPIVTILPDVPRIPTAVAALGAALAVVVAMPGAAVAQSPTAQATLLGQFGDWGSYTASPGGRKICFALSKPVSGQTNPPNRRTDANVVYLFVSTRPAEKVKDEVSILITGYAFRANSDATATIGGANFAMYTQKDGAWVKNAAEEGRMVEAMRKGADLVIKATTSRGTQTTDTFSLKGVTQALDKAAEECK